MRTILSLTFFAILVNLGTIACHEDKPESKLKIGIKKRVRNA